MALNANALVTRDQAKEHIGIPLTNNVQNTVVDLFVNAASQMIETYTDRKLVSVQQPDEYHHGRRQNFIQPRQWPVTSIVELRIDNEREFTDATTLIDASDIFIADAGQTILYDGHFPNGFSNIRVRYVAGYATIPADLQLACLWLVEWYYRHRERQDIGRTSSSKGDESVGVLSNMPEMITEIIESYKRTEAPSINSPVENL